MAADQYLAEVREGKRYTKLVVLGRRSGKWWRARPYGGRRSSRWMRVWSAPRVHVGRCSTLKAALFEDPTTYVPGPVEAIFKLIPGTAKVTDELIAKVEHALRLPNHAAKAYSKINTVQVLAWLRARRGKCVIVLTD